MRGVPARALRFEDGYGRWQSCVMRDYAHGTGRYCIRWDDNSQVSSLLHFAAVVVC